MHCFTKTMSQSGNKFIKSMSLINLLPQKIKKELKKSKLEVLTNENDFLVKNLKKAG